VAWPLPKEASRMVSYDSWALKVFAKSLLCFTSVRQTCKKHPLLVDAICINQSGEHDRTNIFGKRESSMAWKVFLAYEAGHGIHGQHPGYTITPYRSEKFCSCNLRGGEISAVDVLVIIWLMDYFSLFKELLLEGLEVVGNWFGSQL
jgi:hypothetical protein